MQYHGFRQAILSTQSFLLTDHWSILKNDVPLATGDKKLKASAVAAGVEVFV
jgi:hypothetical protein